ncbi:MAG: glycosyltransferase [Emcibacteraceae bacterium]|nr:glycosyltransferase [Emcibacteraceae bacterium]
MIKVAVLLTTYNAEEFVDLQIASILSQRNVLITLFILDDFSSDATPQILRKYARSDDRIKLVNARKRNGNAAKSFYELISHVVKVCDIDFDFVALADHDDIWLPLKVFSAVDKINLAGADCYSSSIVSVDVSQNGIGRAVYQNKSIRSTPYDFWFQGPGPGCSFVLRYSFLKEFGQLNLLDNDIYWHDWFMYFYARSKDIKWYIDSEAHFFYVQHGQNETGANITIKNKLQRFKIIRNGWYLKEVKKMRNVCKYHHKDLEILLSGKFLAKIKLMSRAFDLRRGRFDSLIFYIILLFVQRKGN